MKAIIGVAIGLVLVFIVTAVIVSSVTEIVAWLVQMRARKLEIAVAKLVGENGDALTAWLKGLKPGDLEGDGFANPAPPGPGGAADPIPLARSIYQHPLISATMSTKTSG